MPLVKPVSLLVAAGFTMSLSGCASLPNFGLLTNNQAATSVATETAKTVLPSLMLGSVVGPPKSIGSSLKSSIASALAAQSVPVVTDPKKAAYTLKGYMAAMPQKTGTKLAYIWDVLDKKGKRVHRINDNEFVKGVRGRNVWNKIGAANYQSIATKSAASLMQWLPQQAASPASAALASAQTAATGVKTAANTALQAPVKTASLATKKLKTGPVLAMVPVVVGAPGDGKKSLTAAIKRQLLGKGLVLTPRKTANTYTVRGQVRLSAVSAGQQNVQIDWNVYSPDGKRLGTVSQKNKIPAGSLDGKWGAVADAAAGAAAQGIVKLIPRS